MSRPSSTQAPQSSPSDCLITPLQEGFDKHLKDDPVAFMTSPPTKSASVVSRQGNGSRHGGNAPLLNDLQRVFAQYNSFGVSNGGLVEQYANVPTNTLVGIHDSNSEGTANTIMSPIPLTPGYAQKLMELCGNNVLENQPCVTQSQQLAHNQAYGASNFGSRVSDMHSGLLRSQSAIQLPRNANSVARLTRLHPEGLHHLQAAHNQPIGLETRSATPQPDAKHMTLTTTGLMRNYRPSIPGALGRPISQPVKNPRYRQQSVELVEERQHIDELQNVFTHGVAEEQGSSPGGNLIYANISEAIASQAATHLVDPYTDKTFPASQRAKQRYVVQLISAMYDVSEATDSEKVKKAWQEFLGTDHKSIEVTCWILMEATMRAHGQKEPLVAPRSKNSKGKTKFASFKEHIDAICNGMRHHKTICQHLMAPDYTDGYIDNPIAGADRVGNNRKVNLKKKQTIDRGRLAEQHNRQTSEPSTMQRQSTQPCRQPSYQMALPSTEHDDRELIATHESKATKSKKRKLTEAATDLSHKKSKSSRTSNFPIKQGVDGIHYVGDTSEHHPIQSSHSQLNMFQPVNHEPSNPNAAHAGNVTMAESIGPSRSYSFGHPYQRARHVQQPYNEQQDYERPHTQIDQSYQQTFDGAVCNEGDFNDEDLDAGADEVAEYDFTYDGGADNELAGYNEADCDETGHTLTQYVEPPRDEPIHQESERIQTDCENPAPDCPARERPARGRPNLAPITISNQAVEAPLSSLYHDLKSGGYPGNPMPSAQLIDSLFNGDLPEFAEFGPPTPTNDFESHFHAMLPEQPCVVDSTASSFFTNDLALPAWHGSDDAFPMDGSGVFFP